MLKISKHLVSILVFSFFLFIAFGSEDEKSTATKSNSSTSSTCGCYVPSVSIPSYADSWDDKTENWSYKTCAIAESKEFTEKIHIYVYYNSKIDKYRCELLYSWPGNDCRMSSKLAGMNATSTADITKTVYESGEWKKYQYWFSRQGF
jgi:hypothetical protein